jgi:hypothetical protein
MAPSEKEQAIAENYEAFETLLPELMIRARGKYALLRNRELVEIFETAGEAHLAGIKRFDDERFSVQKVEEKPIDLGFFSYAGYRRVA